MMERPRISFSSHSPYIPLKIATIRFYLPRRRKINFQRTEKKYFPKRIGFSEETSPKNP